MTAIAIAVAGTFVLLAAVVRWLPVDEDATAELGGRR
jgi:hypothetical protein